MADVAALSSCELTPVVVFVHIENIRKYDRGGPFVKSITRIRGAFRSKDDSYPSTLHVYCGFGCSTR